MQVRKRKRHDLSQIGSELHKLEREKKTSMAMIAKAANISPNALSAICRGRANPSMTALNMIAEKYGKRVIVLFIGA